MPDEDQNLIREYYYKTATSKDLQQEFDEFLDELAPSFKT